MSNEGSKLPQKKKNDLLRKFLNAQEYTKTLKKSAMNVVDDSVYGGFSYDDEIQSYRQNVPQSAKLPSRQVSHRERLFSNNLGFSIESMKANQSMYLTGKSKSKKTYNYNNMTLSGNQIQSAKSKKSSYSQIDKSQTIPRTITGDKPVPIKIKDYDALSMDKEKHNSELMHESLGTMGKNDTFSKPKTKKSFNYSNLQEYESQKLSLEQQNSLQNLRKNSKPQEKTSHSPQINKEQPPYNLSPSNFIKLINKVQELENVILLYQQAVQMLKKRIFTLEEQKKSSKMSQICVASLKEEIFQEKKKNAQLREKLGIQENYIKQYERILIESVEKIGNFYQTEISKITMLEKQNKFLKFMLRLELQHQDPNILQDQIQQKQHKQTDQKEQNHKNVIKITKNFADFKERFTNLHEKHKSKNKN